MKSEWLRGGWCLWETRSLRVRRKERRKTGGGKDERKRSKSSLLIDHIGP